MKTFQQFVTEVYDRSFDTATRQQGEGGRVRASRKKSEVEKKRTKVDPEIISTASLCDSLRDSK